MRVWEVETGTCQQVLTGHSHYVSAVCISRDGRFIVSGSWDRTVRWWNTAANTRAASQLRVAAGHETTGGDTDVIT